MIHKSDLKFYIGIGMILLIGSLHIVFFDNDSKYDVYLFYDHKRYLTNILYDISTLFDFTILSYFLSLYNRKIFRPLFFLSIMFWFSYFIFYNQIGTLLLIPIYVIMAVKHIKKWRDK